VHSKIYGAWSALFWSVPFHISQAFMGLTSAKCFICKNLRINTGLLKYGYPQRKPVREDSEGIRYRQVWHCGEGASVGEWGCMTWDIGLN
jgi:hypothetical protein